MKLQKKRIRIPNKKTMNLYHGEDMKKSASMFVIGVLLIIVISVLIFQFLVIRRYTNLNSLRSEVELLREEHEIYEEYVKDYSDLRAEYLKYSDSYIEDSVKLVDRMDILDLLQTATNGYGYIKSVDIESNEISLSIITSSLDSLNVVKRRLERSDIVSEIHIYQASHDDDGLTSSIVFSVSPKGEEE